MPRYGVQTTSQCSSLFLLLIPMVFIDNVQYKVWIKQSQEMSFLYGNNILKSGLARITESTPQYQGVIVYNSQDVPLGMCQGVLRHVYVYRCM
jgi:ribosome biogenesis protein Nip4